VTLPGSVCEACTPHEVAPNNTWLPIALADLLEGIGGGIVAPHSQSSPSSLHLVRVLKERGKLHLLKGTSSRRKVEPISLQPGLSALI